MTLKEAKKILKKEGYFLVKVSKGFEFSELPVWEKTEVVEAKRVVNENGFATAMNTNEWLDRQERLKKECEKHTKAPCSGEEQTKEKKGIIYPTTFPKADFYYKHVLNEGNPAIKESASQFNDALLDEQAKKIEELTKDKELMKKASLTQLDDFIEIYNLLTKESQKVKRLGKEIAKLNSIIHDKNAILSDVAEELRLSKIREKNLVEVSQKYMKENEELKNNIADKVVVKIDAQALKSAESALAYKEKVIAEKDEVIDKLTKENNDYKKVVEEFRNKIADMTIGKIEIQNIRLKEKDEVIADLTHELKAKHKKYVWYKGAYDAAQQILNTIADYAAKHPDKKISDPMVEENHPTIDNPEEIEIEKAVKLVRKAMKEGHTVTIDYKD